MPFTTLGAAEPGNYLFLHSKIVGCGEKTYFVDYAEVTEDGKATFLDKYEINVIGQSVAEIERQLVNAIGADTGHFPKTISILELPGSEVADMTEDLERLRLPRVKCRGLQQPASPRRDIKPTHGLANAVQESSGIIRLNAVDQDA